MTLSIPANNPSMTVETDLCSCSAICISMGEVTLRSLGPAHGEGAWCPNSPCSYSATNEGRLDVSDETSVGETLESRPGDRQVEARRIRSESRMPREC